MSDIDSILRQIKPRVSSWIARDIAAASTTQTNDHGRLVGLGDDDHLQYVHLTTARSIVAQHTFAPTAPAAPFALNANAQGQVVTGLLADGVNKSVTAGSGLTGGGSLAAGSVTLDINLASPSGLLISADALQIADGIAGSGLTISSKVLAINLASPSGLEIATDQLQLDDNIAGAGLTITSKVLAVGQGDGLTVGADAVALTTPGTLSISSTNSSSGSHTHAITTSSNPGAAASILASDASGYLTLVRLNTDVISDKSGANLTLSPTGDITLDPTGNDVLPNSNYDINLGAINKKYLTLHAAELWVETLVAQNTLATIGGRILVGPTTVLVQDFAAADTTMYVKHNEMAVGDRVYLEANGKVEFIAITSGPTIYGPVYYYGVTRNLDGSGANDWYAGDAVFNTGTTGEGFIDLYSIRGVKEATDYGPTIVGNVRVSTTYNDWAEHWAIGNLNGLYGYGTNTYGAAFGKYANSESYLTIDATNGIRMRYKDSEGVETTRAQWDVSGNILIGQTGASQDNIYISAGAIAIRNNTTDRIEMSAAGILTINNSAGSAVFTFNSSSGAEFTLPLTLATGGGIYQGTGTFASPTTGLKIYNSSGIGMIAGYNTGTVQWYGNTDGKLYAGAGNVVLDASGVTLKRTTHYQFGIRWCNSSLVTRGWMDSDDAGFYITTDSDDGTRTSEFYLENTSSGVREVFFQVGSGAAWSFDNQGGGSGGRGEIHFSWSDLGIDGGVHIGADYGTSYNDDLVVDGGIHVGATPTDPAVGAITTTADVKVGTGLYVGSSSGTTYDNDINTTGGLHLNVTGDPTAGTLKTSSNAWVGGGLVVGNTSTTPVTDAIIADGDIYTDAWQSYSATINIGTGGTWVTQAMYYKRVGKLVFFAWSFQGTTGTSCPTVLTIPLPYNWVGSYNYTRAPNSQNTTGGSSTFIGLQLINTASPGNLLLYKNALNTSDNWPSSSGFESFGWFIYQSV